MLTFDLLGVAKALRLAPHAEIDRLRGLCGSYMESLAKAIAECVRLQAAVHELEETVTRLELELQEARRT